MNILHTIASLGTAAGGPSRTVPALCEALRAVPGLNVRIATSKASNFGSNVRLPHVPVHESVARNTKDWVKTLSDYLNCFGADSRDSGLILHDHGQWLPINRASARVARKNRIARIVTPRGMLSPWAMQHRRWKKTAAWYCFARRDVFSANVVHATSELEAEELRQLGLKNPVAIIPNGVDRPLLDVTTVPKKKQVLFLSRLHPKKGVSELVQVWRKIRPEGWELILAGPDESAIVPKLALTAADTVRWAGDVEGDEKWRLLAESRLFVLPSYSENFGVVVAESLIAGTPVIATHGTPWASLLQHGCGWWISMTPQILEDTLRQALARPAEDLLAMGVRGRDFAISAFGWTAIAEQIADVYRWMLTGGAVPSCIQIR